MRGRSATILLAGALALLAVVGLSKLGVFERAEQRSQDLRFAVRGTQPVDGITVVGIDEASFADLGDITWPIRRSLHARALDALKRAGARQVVYDVQFTEPSQRPADDLALFRAVRRGDGVILATGEIDDDGGTAVLGSRANQRRYDARVGAANFLEGRGGSIRRYEPAVAGLPTIAALTAAQVAQAPRAFGDGSALIDFRGPPGTIPTVSFSDLVQGRVDEALLRDRIVVVGATAANLQDRHPTPAGGGMMSGPEIQANAILTALDDNPLRAVPGPVAALLVLLCGVAGIVAILVMGPVRGAAAAVVLGVAYAGAAQLAFSVGAVLPLATPLIAMGSSAVAALLAATAREIALRRAISWRNRELENAVRGRTRELELSQLEIVERLARASELRDDDTGQHIDRMSHLCELVALELGQSPEEATLLRRAAVLHDIGKLGLPDSILCKPGRLTPEEIYVMREHTSQGGALLEGSASPIMQLAETIARTHHERWDGTGYPARLKGEEIPLVGRIAAVCDVFDALVSVRPYKEAWPVTKARAEIGRCAGSHFDPVVADALLTVTGRQISAPDWIADILTVDAHDEGGSDAATRTRLDVAQATSRA